MSAIITDIPFVSTGICAPFATCTFCYVAAPYCGHKLNVIIKTCNQFTCYVHNEMSLLIVRNYKNIEVRMKRLGVVGLGYVGLPLAVHAAQKGYTVTGVDLNTALVSQINAGESPYKGIDDRFTKSFESLKSGALTATSDMSELKGVETIVVCVPTPTINNKPDLTYVLDVAKALSKVITPGTTVVLESTVNPGVTREDFLPVLQDGSGLQVGKDFYLAHCPERIDPGNPKWFVGNLNRVIGGITESCTTKAQAFYESIIDADIVPLGSAEEAEFVKSWENTHRNVMIALANHAAVICDAMDMNVDRVLDGLQTKVDQFGLQLARPGIGPGGHCIPEDIHYVIKKARQNDLSTSFLESAAQVNDGMPLYAVHSFMRHVRDLGIKMKDTHVALLGLAYKPDIADMRRSPSVEVGYELARRAAAVTVFDPYIAHAETQVKGTIGATTLEDALKDADTVFIGTAHSEFKKMLTPALLKAHNIKFVFDGRNCLDAVALTEVNIAYKGVGK